MTPAVQPLVLVANADKWLTESLESVLTQGGYQVLATARRQQVLEQARSHRPDGILLDLGLDRRVTDSFALCRALRADPSVSRATPIILMTAGPALRMQQIEALRAGAWELRGDPLDMEELVLRLGLYVQGKLEVDRLGAEALVDRASGLYNGAGVTRRAAELAALAVRQGTPMACAVFKPAEDGDTMMPGAADRLAQAFRSAGRISDALGRTGPAEFTVFAPATDEMGAHGLVQRITDTVARTAAVKLRAGVSAAPAPSAPSQLSPPDLLEDARKALR